MVDREQLQREALEELISYSEKLIPAVQDIIVELRGGELEDTKEFLRDIINGINWEIEVYNQCAPFINQSTSLLDKKEMIQVVNEFGIALKSGNPTFVADCFQDRILSFLNKLAVASKIAIGES